MFMYVFIQFPAFYFFFLSFFVFSLYDMRCFTAVNGRRRDEGYKMHNPFFSPFSPLFFPFFFFLRPQKGEEVKPENGSKLGQKLQSIIIIHSVINPPPPRPRKHQVNLD